MYIIVYKPFLFILLINNKAYENILKLHERDGITRQEQFERGRFNPTKYFVFQYVNFSFKNLLYCTHI